MARAACERTSRLTRLIPRMSTTVLSMKMSLSATNWRTVPDASVLAMTFGTPSGSARIAAVAIVVPAEPPRPRTPATSPRACASRVNRAAPSAAQVTASPRSAIASGAVPASAKICSRVTSGGTVGGASEPTSTSVVRTCHPSSRSRTKAASRPFVSRVANIRTDEDDLTTARAVTIVATPAMRALLLAASVLVSLFSTFTMAAQEPLRVFIRSGPKSHGPGAHDYPSFLRDWVPLLNARGAKAVGADTFPTRAQLDQTDVLILHKQDAGTINDPADRQNLAAFVARGGGVVVIHAGSVSNDPDWFKTIVGGSWRNGTTKWLEGPMHLYFTDRESPITTGVSNWSMDDEIYFDMDILPEARVLAAAYTPKPAGARDPNSQKRAEALTGGGKRVSIYDIQPQMWTYERTASGGSAPYRAFVSIPGHLYVNFNRPNYRAILLRGIAWAGKRANVDELLAKDELGDALRYVEGGPTHPAKAAEKIEVHPEFDLSLVAAEPLIQKAMNLDWDERGRLWVSETPEYPNGRRALTAPAWRDSGSVRQGPTRDPEDTISILTDTNGDGVMDRKHVFADKLELVTGFVLYRNGVIAATSPDIWYLEDTNGDQVADKRTKLYTGLGTSDTHSVINNLRWGLDGWVYATHGYSAGTVTSADGAKNFGRDGSGVVRFKPDGSAFEQYSSRGGNTWGLDITWDGQVFWTQPTSGTVFFHTVLPESVLAKGRIPGTTSAKGMISGQSHLSADDLARAGLRADRPGRSVHRGCRMCDLRWRRVARQMAVRLLHR